jgi:hypothetical protein
MLLQRFTLRPAPGQQQPGIRLQVTLRPQGGLHLMLEPRKVASAPAASPQAQVQGRADDAVGCPFH